MSEMREACSRRREQAIVSLCSLIATDASENQRADISVLGFYVCYKIGADLTIRATRIHALYLCANTTFCDIVCDSTQVCADKLT